VKAAPFDYHAPETVAEAAGLLADFGDEAKVLAWALRCYPEKVEATVEVCQPGS
jgi:CO/xanthine dehydrogenase FAD-binding subunit